MGIFSAVSLFDRFRRPILFYSRKNQKQSTKTGIFLSITIYSFLIYYFLSSEMVLRKNPKVVDQTIEINPRPEIALKNLVFSLEDTESVSIIDPSLFSIVINLWNNQIDETKRTGFNILYYLEEDLRACREDDFDPGVFEKYGFENKYCFNNKTLNLKGYWDETKINYFSVSLRRCVNSTKNNNTCQSDEAIDAFLTNDLYFSLYLLNPYVDMRNYGEPIKSTWKILFCLSDPNAYKTYSVYIKKVEFIDDHNLPFVSEIVHDLYNLDKVESDIQIRNRAKDCATFFFYSSNVITQKSRRYQGLSDVIAQMGGLFGVFMIIGIIITEPEFKMNTIKSFFGERVSFKNNPEINFDEENRMDSDQSPNFDPLSTGKRGDIINPSEAASIPSDPDFKNDTERFEKVARDIKIINTVVKEQQINELIIKNVENEKPVGDRGCNIEPNNENVFIKKQVSAENIPNTIPKSKSKPTNLFKNNTSFYKSEKIEGEKDISSNFEFALTDYLKLKLKETFKLKLNKNENIFRNLELKFREDLNIGYLLQRVFILENKFELLISDSPVSFKQTSIIGKDPPMSLKKAKSRKISIYDFLGN